LRLDGQSTTPKRSRDLLRLARLKALERENARLKKLLAEAELDKAILEEAASGNF
jgi:hypothetical protein